MKLLIEKISFKQMWFLAIGAFAIQFVLVLELLNSSLLLRFLGVSEKKISLLLLVVPCSALIIHPLIGFISDATLSRYGRRVPFLAGCTGVSCIALGGLLVVKSVNPCVLLLILLNCSINGCLECMRALIGDITPQEQKTTLFAVQALACGVGGSLAAILPWYLNSLHIFINAGATADQSTPLIKVTLFISALVLVYCMVKMLSQIHEREFIDFEVNPAATSLSFAWKDISLAPLLILRRVIAASGELYANLVHLPQIIREFFLIQCLTWAAFFIKVVYLGMALAQQVFGLPPGVTVATNHNFRQLLEQGSLEAGICIAISQLSSMAYILLLPQLVRRFSAYKLHALALLVGGLSLMSMLFFTKIELIYTSAIGLGIVLGSVMTIPYALITAQLPAEKMGTYLGIFNITTAIPQILCGLLIGFINDYLFWGHAVLSIFLGGILYFIAGILLWRRQIPAVIS
jgi:maltose/moltooligosaccharide transporter